MLTNLRRVRSSDALTVRFAAQAFGDDRPDIEFKPREKILLRMLMPSGTLIETTHYYPSSRDWQKRELEAKGAVEQRDSHG